VSEPKAEAEAEAAEPAATPEPPQIAGIKRKNLIIIAVVLAGLWAFAINTGSTVVEIIVGVLTALVLGVLVWASRMIRKQKGMIDLLKGATASPEAKRDALAKLSEGKDASSPTKVFARAQLIASDDPKAALELLKPIELKTFPAAMQDDVSLLKTQLYLNLGRTAEARKCADVMNLDNPQRKEMRPLAASIVAEAFARTGKPKQALALLDSIELPAKAKDAENIQIQMKVARVFARFAANQRNQARTELVALADVDPNHLGKFILPQFRVHPELQKLARQVLEGHPGARKVIKRVQR